MHHQGYIIHDNYESSKPKSFLNSNLWLDRSIDDPEICHGKWSLKELWTARWELLSGTIEGARFREGSESKKRKKEASSKS